MKKYSLKACGIAITLFASTSLLGSQDDVQKVLFSKKKDAEIITIADNVNASVCNNPAKALSKAFTATAKKAIPSVVFIRVESTYEGDMGEDPYDLFNDEFFYKFFGKPSRPQKPQPQISQGSGFFVSADGYIMTNYHVVANAKQMTVTLQNGDNAEYSATLVGGDPQTDVAVIKVESPDQKPFPFLDFGNSEDVEIGEWVVAVGNPFQLEASVTVGVISAKGRQNLHITELEDFIQTDAAINPGNSGGPLLDLDGTVIGINTAIVSRSGGYMGIGFAVPSNIAKTVYTQIVGNGSVTRGFLGVSMQPIDKDLADALGLDKAEGALVSDVVEDSPAAKAGILQGDIILEVNGVVVKSPASIRNEIMLKEPGKKLPIKINRKGKIITVQVTLGTYSKASQMKSENAQLLGLTVENLSKENISKYKLSSTDEGVVITEVKPGSMGAKIGLKPGFVVLSLNHKRITSVNDFNDALSSIEKGKKVLILVKAGDMSRFFSIKMN